MGLTPRPERKVPTQTILTSGSRTYNTLAGATWLRVRMVGGGGGGGGSGTGSTSASGAGGNSTFGTTFKEPKQLCM